MKKHMFGDVNPLNDIWKTN